MTQSQIFECIDIVKDNISDSHGGSHLIYSIPGINSLVEECINEVLSMGWEEEDGEIVNWDDFLINVEMLVEERAELDEMEDEDEDDEEEDSDIENE